MGLWGIVMIAANAAQFAVWGKKALESDKGKAAVAEVKKKAGAAGTTVQAGAVIAGAVATEAGRVITEKTRPIRETLADKIDKITGMLEQSETDAATKANPVETETEEEVTVEAVTDSATDDMPKAKDSW